MANPPVTDVGVDAVAAALRAGCLASGGQVQRWEAEVALLVEADHVVATSSHTTAVQLALGAAWVGSGMEVIVPAVGCPSWTWAISSLGAVPVAADVDAHTWMLSPDTVTPALSDATAAVLVVDYSGVPAPVEVLRDTVGPNVAVIEFAAHAFGSRRAGRPVGAAADMAVWSWDTTETFGVGHLGAVTTDDFDTSELLCHDREVMTPGPNGPPDELRCALAVGQRPRIAGIWEARHANLTCYREGLSDLGDMVQLQQIEPGDYVVPSFMPVLVSTWEHRNKVVSALRDAEVQADTHYPALHHEGASEPLAVQRSPLTYADWVSARVIVLPVHEGLSSPDVDRVIDIVRNAL